MNTIIEVEIWRFKKDDEVNMTWIGDLFSLNDVTFESVTEELPLEPEKIDLTQITEYREETHRFKEDWIGFGFACFGENGGEFRSGLQYLIDQWGFEETIDLYIKGYREDFLKWAGEPKLMPQRKEWPCQRILVAAEYWCGKTFHEEFEDGLEIYGRIDMNHINLIKE